MKYDSIMVRIALVAALFVVAPQSRAFDLTGDFLLLADRAMAHTRGETTLAEELTVVKLKTTARIWGGGTLRVSSDRTCNSTGAPTFICAEFVSFNELIGWIEYCGNGTGLSFGSDNNVIDIANWGTAGIGQLTDCEKYDPYLEEP